MLARRGEKISGNPARRERLKQEYGRLVARVKNFLASRPQTHLLCLDRSAVLRDPEGAASNVNGFSAGTWRWHFWQTR
jgi:hypothetical protein